MKHIEWQDGERQHPNPCYRRQCRAWIPDQYRRGKVESKLVDLEGFSVKESFIIRDAAHHFEEQPEA